MATQVVSGQHRIILLLNLVTMMQCYSTYLVKGTSLIKEQDPRLIFIHILGLCFHHLILLNLVFMKNHLMLMNNAFHGEINVAIKFQLMILVKTCSQTRRMEVSQLVSLKFGMLNTLIETKTESEKTPDAFQLVCLLY